MSEYIKRGKLNIVTGQHTLEFYTHKNRVSCGRVEGDDLRILAFETASKTPAALKTGKER